jgi:hypothetical protein
MAILMPGFQQTSGVKVMAHNRGNRLGRFGASTLAAPLTVLRELAAAVDSKSRTLAG